MPIWSIFTNKKTKEDLIKETNSLVDQIKGEMEANGQLKPLSLLEEVTHLNRIIVLAFKIHQRAYETTDTEINDDLVLSDKTQQQIAEDLQEIIEVLQKLGYKEPLPVTENRIDLTNWLNMALDACVKKIHASAEKTLTLADELDTTLSKLHTANTSHRKTPVRRAENSATEVRQKVDQIYLQLDGMQWNTLRQVTQTGRFLDLKVAHLKTDLAQAEVALEKARKEEADARPNWISRLWKSESKYQGAKRNTKQKEEIVNTLRQQLGDTRQSNNYKSWGKNIKPLLSAVSEKLKKLRKEAFWTPAPDNVPKTDPTVIERDTAINQIKPRIKGAQESKPFSDLFMFLPDTVFDKLTAFLKPPAVAHDPKEETREDAVDDSATDRKDATRTALPIDASNGNGQATAAPPVINRAAPRLPATLALVKRQNLDTLKQWPGQRLGFTRLVRTDQQFFGDREGTLQLLASLARNSKDAARAKRPLTIAYPTTAQTGAPQPHTEKRENGTAADQEAKRNRALAKSYAEDLASGHPYKLKLNLQNMLSTIAQYGKISDFKKVQKWIADLQKALTPRVQIIERTVLKVDTGSPEKNPTKNKFEWLSQIAAMFDENELDKGGFQKLPEIFKANGYTLDFANNVFTNKQTASNPVAYGLFLEKVSAKKIKTPDQQQTMFSNIVLSTLLVSVLGSEDQKLNMVEALKALRKDYTEDIQAAEKSGKHESKYPPIIADIFAGLDGTASPIKESGLTELSPESPERTRATPADLSGLRRNLFIDGREEKSPLGRPTDPLSVSFS